MKRSLASLFLAVGVAACSSSGDATGAGTTSSTGAGGGGAGGSAPAIGGDRPVTVHAPPNLAPGAKAPLLLMLHGYGIDGTVEEFYLQLQPLADERGFFYAHPDGTADSMGSHFWNATDACCDYDHSGVDDSGYLANVIREIEAAYAVDPKRVYVFGHSNGGFMAYRLACDHADLVTAVASLAGAMWEDVSRCKPSEPVSVLEIHGTSDTEVIYDGSTVENYPSAEVTVGDWATLDGCAASPTSMARALDLESSLAGKETDVERFESCTAGRDVELWTIQGASHIPNWTKSFQPTLADWLVAQKRP